MPSQIKSEFPWIETGELADYYERGQAWEGECLKSWNKIETFYRDPEYKRTFNEKMLDLIAQMRAKGYDRTLRAGQSLWTLVLSRSRKHGLRTDQPCLHVNFAHQGEQIRVNFDYGPPHFFETTNLTPEIEVLLKDLESQAID